MELKNAYPAEAGIKSYKRSFRLDGGAVKLGEHIELDRPQLIDFHYMTHIKPTLIKEGEISLAEGMTLRYGTELTANIEELDPVGLNARGDWGVDTLYRIHLTVTAQSYDGTVTVE